ncbi:MAG TPA: HAMP domain-containing sensor histidine kinase [Thermaerobacter sp.]
MVIFRPLRELGGVHRAIVTWLVTGTGLALAGALVAGWTVGYGLVRRLRVIQRAAGELAEGDLSRRVTVRGRDEVAELARHFNYMAGRLEALVAELRRSERLRRSMLAVVSHELRTPVTVIRGLAEAMRDGLVAGGPEARRGAGRIVAEAERLGRLLEDLFDVARIEAGQLDVRLRRLPAGRWLAEAVAGLEALARQFGARLEATLAPELGEAVVEADPDRLGQVLANLVGNAARHAGRDGQVRLAATLAGDRLRVEVADDGPGIDPADLPHVFEPFYRGGTAARSRGAGLGLSIARAIVEAHGGHIGVTSRQGEGASFWFTVPLAPGPAHP